MFTAQNGARVQTPKILVLLTDGSQTNDKDAEDPSMIAEEMRSHGIALLVVGIGSGNLVVYSF